MKIICNKKEFAEMVRSCEGAIASDDCNACVFAGLCSHCCSLERGSMDFIEDVCEISTEE